MSSPSPPPLSSLLESATLPNPPPAIHLNNFHMTSRSLTIASGFMFAVVVCALMISLLFIVHYYHQRRLTQYRTRVYDIESRVQSQRLAEFRARQTAEEEGSAAAAEKIAFREIKREEMGDCECGCAICIEGFEKEDICGVTESCGHFFHKDCIDQWLRIERRRPLCRCLVELP